MIWWIPAPTFPAASTLAGENDAPPGNSAAVASHCKASPPRYWAWAELMRRAFGIDVLECPECGGRMRVFCTITDPKIIDAILDHLAGRGPPSAPPPPSVLH